MVSGDISAAKRFRRDLKKKFPNMSEHVPNIPIVR